MAQSIDVVHDPNADPQVSMALDRLLEERTKKEISNEMREGERVESGTLYNSREPLRLYQSLTAPPVVRTLTI